MKIFTSKTKSHKNSLSTFKFAAVSAFPTIFSATHIYRPSCSLATLSMVNRWTPFSLSMRTPPSGDGSNCWSPLNQVIRGSGNPVTLHSNVTFSASGTDLSWRSKVNSGAFWTGLSSVSEKIDKFN